MKKWIYLHLKLLSLSLIILNGASGQTLRSDTTLQNALNNASVVYTKAIGAQLPLNNGPEYYFYNPVKFRGSAYFMDTTYTPGSVYYDGAEYKEVQLLYDLNKGQLAAILYDQNLKYVLLNDRVQNFDLLKHHFININADTLTKNTVMTSGYYDELYHGRTEVVSKRYKTIQRYNSTTGAQEAYSYFTETKEDFFIRKDNIYYNVAGKRELLDILKDKKKQLQQYVKGNNIKFNKDRGQALASVAAYYDHITN
jgi:hypothetical protein